MSVAQIGQLHRRYVRLADAFKAFWTYNQFATAAFKNFLQLPLPYNIDFQRLYESIRATSDVFQSAIPPPDAGERIDACERELQRVSASLFAADESIRTSVLRRFLERLKQQDEKIIFNLVKFYLYTGRLTGDPRDKLDFLFTKIGEEYSEERAAYWSKDSAELRKQFQSLVAIARLRQVGEAEASDAIASIHDARDRIQDVSSFDDLSRLDLLEELRSLKRNLGDVYFHPDVLLAVVECNVATKNRFLRLYREEEQQIITDAQKLVSQEDAIRRKLGSTHPGLMDEMERFRRFKQEFDESRARADIKHSLIKQLRASMNAILGQLEIDLDTPRHTFEESMGVLPFDQNDKIESRFGHDPLLKNTLARIIGLLDNCDVSSDPGKIAASPEIEPLRLEPWEIAAYFKLYRNRPLDEEETEDLMLMYLRGVALRILVDEQARKLATGGEIDSSVLDTMRVSLDRAKELDQLFGELLHEGIYYTDPKVLHSLYRSRFRLLRGFSGLWLIYDQRTGGSAGPIPSSSAAAGW